LLYLTGYIAADYSNVQHCARKPSSDLAAGRIDKFPKNRPAAFSNECRFAWRKRVKTKDWSLGSDSIRTKKAPGLADKQKACPGLMIQGLAWRYPAEMVAGVRS
jgi:hypothetical protein